MTLVSLYNKINSSLPTLENISTSITTTLAIATVIELSDRIGITEKIGQGLSWATRKATTGLTTIGTKIETARRERQERQIHGLVETLQNCLASTRNETLNETLKSYEININAIQRLLALSQRNPIADPVIFEMLHIVWGITNQFGFVTEEHTNNTIDLLNRTITAVIALSQITPLPDNAIGFLVASLNNLIPEDISGNPLSHSSITKLNSVIVTTALNSLSQRANLPDNAIVKLENFLVKIVRSPDLNIALRNQAASAFIDLSHRANLPNDAISDLVTRLHTISTEETLNIALRNQAADALIALSHRANLPNDAIVNLENVLIETVRFSDLNMEFKNQATAALIALSHRTNLPNDAISHLVTRLHTISTEETLNIALRNQAATRPMALTTDLSQRNPISTIEISSIFNNLCKIFNTRELPLLVRQMAFNRLPELVTEALRRNMDDENLHRIIYKLSIITAPVHMFWHLIEEPFFQLAEEPFSQLARNSLRQIANARPHFREHIQHLLPAQVPIQNVLERPLISDTQLVHAPSVHSSAGDSIVKLNTRYGSDLDEEKVIRALRSFLSNPLNFPDLENKRVEALACFERLLYFERAEAVEAKSQLTLQRILCLVWAGVNDPRLHPPQEITACQRDFIHNLNLIQHQYADGSPSCIGGTFNQLVDILGGYHPDVRIVLLNSLLITDIVKESVLGQFIKQNVETQRLLLQEEKGPDVYDLFIKTVQEKIRTCIRELGGIENAKGICVGERCVMPIEDFNATIDNELLQGLLSITTPKIIPALIEKVAQEVLSSYPASLQEMLKHPEKPEFSKAVFSDFAIKCREAIQTRLTSFEAIYAPDGIRFGKDLVIPGNKFGELISDKGLQNAIISFSSF